jgi:hypothetical protein
LDVVFNLLVPKRIFVLPTHPDAIISENGMLHVLDVIMMMIVVTINISIAKPLELPRDNVPGNLVVEIVLPLLLVVP